MDNYEVIGSLGAGSFGRVYKAKQLSDSTFVALKVISKRGRSAKELTGLRRECEIQRDLNHPNIIKMLDSFETKDEIVVITEFAHKELNKLLGKEGYLSEDRVKPIVWDLVSALYYLHSHRILHRDLKPQNILLDSKNRAKLCDFGFARNMSTGTHVLTSIKGTPLYMAPELIDAQSYDHTADLWSLGCIIYELLVGAPPFNTTSILNLIKLVRHGNIQWPTFLSDDCISFLKGLLQKDPKERMSWQEILNHPFVKGHISVLENITSMPLTRPLSVSTLQVKEQQRKDYVTNKNNFHFTKSPDTDHNLTDQKKSGSSKTSKLSQNTDTCSNDDHNSRKGDVLDVRNNNIQINEKMHYLSIDEKSDRNSDKSHARQTDDVGSKKSDSEGTDKLSFIEENQPMENEEWIVFLQKSMLEVINGEMTTLMQTNLANIIVSPLRNCNANSKVISYVAKLLSMPFVVRGSEDKLIDIKKVYLEVKLVPNLVYSSKLLMRLKNETGSNSLSLSPIQDVYKSTIELSDDDFQTLEYIYMLITHLVYLDNEFLSQFCDAVVILNVYSLLNFLLLVSKVKLKIVLDLIAILTHILRVFPENYELIDRIVAIECPNGKMVNFVDLLRHSDCVLRERSCFLLLFLGKYSRKINLLWNDTVRETLEALMYDSIESVRNAADRSVEELKYKDFYKNI